MSEEKKPSNEIRIKFNSKQKDILAQCEKLLKDGNVKDLHLSAVSSTIADLMVTVEILKSKHPGLSQQSKFTTIPPRQNEKDKKPEEKPTKLFPRLEIILTLNDEKEKKEGSAAAISEEETNVLIETLDKKKDAFKKKKFKKSFRKNNRRLAYNGRRKRYSYSAKKTRFNWRKPAYNNRKPYGKTPNGKNVKFNAPRKNSGNKQVAAKN